MHVLAPLFFACTLLASSNLMAAEPDVAAILAPTGTLRAAINFGNPVLAQRDPASGAAQGASVQLAHELGRRLQVPVQLVLFDEAGLVAAAANRDAWDVAFLAIDPARAMTIAFTAPYVLIEGTYVVPASSALNSVDAVDQPGIRIAVASHSAYDLYLARSLKHAEIIRYDNGAAAEAAFLAAGTDVLAGVRQPLAELVQSRPDLTLMPGRFMAIRQAMAVPKSHEAGLPYLHRFVEEMKASGFVRTALDATNQPGAAVAPPE